MSTTDRDAPSSPAVSVIMPVRGCGDTLPMAIASVLAQSLSDWELLVVADGSDQDVDALLAGLDETRIRLLRSAPPGGRGAARQTGLAAARGELVAFLDGDDWMLPWRLSRQAGALAADPELMLVSGGIVVLDENDAPFGMRRLPAGAGHTRIAPGHLLDSPVLNAASMVRRAAAMECGYDTAYRRGEDAEFFVRYLRGRAYRVEPEPVYCYREFRSFSPGGLRRGLAAERRRYLAHARPGWHKAAALAGWAVKRLAYELVLAAGGRRYLVARRSRPLSGHELASYRRGEALVRGHLPNSERQHRVGSR